MGLGVGATIGGTVGSVIPVVGSDIGAGIGGLFDSIFGGKKEDIEKELRTGATWYVNWAKKRGFTLDWNIAYNLLRPVYYAHEATSKRTEVIQNYIDKVKDQQALNPAGKGSGGFGSNTGRTSGGRSGRTQNNGNLNLSSVFGSGSLTPLLIGAGIVYFITKT